LNEFIVISIGGAPTCCGLRERSSILYAYSQKWIGLRKE